MFFAGRAAIICEICIESEYCAATGGGAPACIFHVFLNIVVEGEFFIFVSKISLEKLG
jgi:hypothetical protein